MEYRLSTVLGNCFNNSGIPLRYLGSCFIVTPHVHAQAGGYVIGFGVHLCLYECDPPKSLSGTLADDLPVSNTHGKLLVEFID